MRTTLDLDDDVLAAARELARARKESIGTVVSALARAGLAPRSIDIVDGLPIIRASADSALITSEMVRRALDDE
ncbi:MAG TPA: hypothetical protein VNO51_14830 [Ilumatobacteraceae bacterium]|nr:hypothetical protein [Ilumatobacteraceae bacterium]